MEKRLDILPLKEWNLFNLFNERRPLLIAGPCSAESEIQIMETRRIRNPDNGNCQRT